MQPQPQPQQPQSEARDQEGALSNGRSHGSDARTVAAPLFNNDEEEGDVEVTPLQRPPPSQSPPPRQRPLSVRDPAALPSTSEANAARSPESSPTQPAPLLGRRGSSGSDPKGSGPAVSKAASAATPKGRNGRPKGVTAAAAPPPPTATAGSPTSASSVPSTPAPSTPATPPAATAKLSERLAELLGGEAGASFASAVEEFIRSRHLSLKDTRALYQRVLPNLSGNPALMASVRDGRLSAAELCLMSNKDMADERTQREREEAARQSLKDVIAAPEVVIAKHTKAGVEYVAVAGEKLTQTDMFDAKVSGLRERLSGNGEKDAAEEEEEEDAWAHAGEAQHSSRHAPGRTPLFDSPMSPSSDDDSRPQFDGATGGRDAVAEIDVEAGDDDDGARSADTPPPSDATTTRRRSRYAEYDADDSALPKRRKVDSVDVEVAVGAEGRVDVSMSPRKVPPSSAALSTSDPVASAADTRTFIRLDGDSVIEQPELPTIDLFTVSPSPSPEPIAVSASASLKSPRSPVVAASSKTPSVVRPAPAATPPPVSVPVHPASPPSPPSLASPASPPSPPESPSIAAVIPSFQSPSSSRSAELFLGPLQSRVRWSGSIQFDHFGFVIPFTARLLAVSGQSDSLDAVRALSSSALPSRVVVNNREPVSAAEELLRETSRSDLRMAVLYVLTPAVGFAKQMEAFCQFHAEKQRVGISDARNADRVGLFFRFGRVAPVDAPRGQTAELSSATLRECFSGTGGLREPRAFVAIVAYLDRRKSTKAPGGPTPPMNAPSRISGNAASPSQTMGGPPTVIPSVSAAHPSPPQAMPPLSYPVPLPPAGFPGYPPQAYAVVAPSAPAVDARGGANASGGPTQAPPVVYYGASPSHPYYAFPYAAAPTPLVYGVAPLGPAVPPAGTQLGGAPPVGSAAAERFQQYSPAHIDVVSRLLSSINPSAAAAAAAAAGGLSAPSHSSPSSSASPYRTSSASRSPPRRQPSPPRDPRMTAPPRSVREGSRDERGSDRDREWPGDRSSLRDGRAYTGEDSAYSSARERERERDRLLESQRSRPPPADDRRRPPQRPALDRQAEAERLNRERERQRLEERERERMRHAFLASNSALPHQQQQQQQHAGGAPSARPTTSGFIHPSRVHPQPR